MSHFIVRTKEPNWLLGCYPNGKFGLIHKECSSAARTKLCCRDCAEKAIAIYNYNSGLPKKFIIEEVKDE